MQTLIFKGHPKIEIPSCEEELTLGQFVELTKMDTTDILAVFSLFTGIEYEKLNNTKDQIEDVIYRSLMWIYDADLKFEKFEPEFIVTINGWTDIIIPQKLGDCTLGQRIFISQDIVKHEKNQYEAYPCALATYLYPSYSGEDFDRDKAEIFIDKVLTMKAFIAVPIARFFLSK